MEKSVKHAVVVGGGPAGLMAAQRLAEAGFPVSLYDAAPSVARKFLMAGRGGLNLTHSEDMARFLPRYGAAQDFLRGSIAAFSPDDLREFAEELGEPTFAGSSGRVFPKSFKASPLLRAWLKKLDALGVTRFPRHRLTGFGTDGALHFATPQGPVEVKADCVVLALGGASWPKLGADGAWVEILRKAGVDIAPLRPANCGFDVAWTLPFIARFEGEPLKTIGLSFDGSGARGEAMITRKGLEGGAIYALSRVLREALDAGRETVLHIDLRPDVAVETLVQKLAKPRGTQSISTFLRKALGLSPVAIGLMREAAGAALPNEAEALAALVKNCGIRLTGVAGIERAISSAGGVRLESVDTDLMLKKLPGVFVAGEMLDWEAPTGGYLLQACFATGHVAGLGAAKLLSRS